MKVFRSICCFIVICEVCIGFFWLFFAGRVLDVSTELASPADLIVVLGGASMGDRLKKGSELYNRGLSDHILVTGFSSNTEKLAPLILDWRIKYLNGLGVPITSILQDSYARTTWMEVSAINQLCLDKHWRRVIVVSDPPHMLRLSWIMKKVPINSGLEYQLVASNPEWWHRDRVWANTTSASFAIMEFIKIIYYMSFSQNVQIE